MSAKSIAGECLYCIQKIRLFKSLARVYYLSALACMDVFIRFFGFTEIKAVFTRHQNWILGISDIDLIIAIRQMSVDEEAAFFKKFHRFYVIYRLFFFVLCPYVEIRFLRENSVEHHPSKRIKEAELLYNFEQWTEIYGSDKNSFRACRFAPEPAGAGLFPLSSFLCFNLYGFFQDSLLSGRPVPGISARVKKCFLRIAQHVYFIGRKSYISLEAVDKEINSGRHLTPSFEKLSSASKKFSLNHADDPAKSAGIIKDTILAVSCAYNTAAPKGGALFKPAHAETPFYIPVYFKEFLEKAGKILDEGKIKLVYYKDPYKFYRINAFFVIDESVLLEDLGALLGLCRKYYKKLIRENVVLRFTTGALLTSQMYCLNGPLALESYFVSNRNVYDKGGCLNIAHPPDEWNAIKIRESIYAFKEFFLPALMFFKGHKKFTYELFDAPELNILLAYFLFFKSKPEFIEALKSANGDPYDLSAYVLSKYGSEMKADCWQTTTLRDSFPHISRMVNMVDEAASELLSKK